MAVVTTRKGIIVPDADTLDEFERNARQQWKIAHRDLQRHPGRPPEIEPIVKVALQVLAEPPPAEVFSERDLVRLANRKLAGLPCKTTVRATIRLLGQVVRTRQDAPHGLRMDTAGNFFLESPKPYKLFDLEQQLSQKLREQMTIRLLMERSLRHYPEYARSRRIAKKGADAFISNPRRFIRLRYLPLYVAAKKLGVPIPEMYDPDSEKCKAWLNG